MIMHRVLDEVLRSWSHVAVLRALMDTLTGFTGNEVARVSGMQPRSALKALSSLEELGIVRRQRGGRDHLFTLNREHFLVRDALLPIYHSERQFPEVIKTFLSASMGSPAVSAVLFGSAARGEETPRSDLDVCCIVKTEKQKEIVQGRLDAMSSELYRKFGVKVAPVYFTVEELQKKSKSSLVKNILSHGKVIAGKNPKDLLHG
jgi:predicted nucleotidyltransferase